MSESASSSERHGRTVGFDPDVRRVGSTSTPSWAFSDDRGREIDLAVVDPVGAELDAVVGMYDDFDAAYRAQGLPPTDAERTREWLTGIRSGLHLVARHEWRTVGHAAVVPDGEGGHELVIFVHQSYHDAGIGTRLLRTLLAHAAATGVERVWLTVERTNAPAVALYEKVGFETEETITPTLKMRLSLAT